MLSVRLALLIALLFAALNPLVIKAQEPGALNITRFPGSSFSIATMPTHFTNVVALARNPNIVLGLRQDGTVAEWNQSYWAAPSDLTDVSSIAIGLVQGVALLSNGTIRTWGASPGSVALNPDLNDITAIASGNLFGLALRSNGRLVAWGDNTHKQLRIPRHKLRRATAIACGATHALALTPKGRVVAWGDKTYKQTAVPRRLLGVYAIAAGGSCSLALKNDGTVVAWGDHRWGQTNVPAGLTDVVAISAGERHCLALKSDGTVVSWGSSDSIGTPVTQPSLQHVSAIAAGSAESFFITQELMAWAWQAPTSAFTGTTTVFEVRTLSQTPVRYQWRRNNVDIPDATNAIYTILSTSPADAGTYTVFVENGFSARTVVVSALSVQAPHVNLTPANSTRTYGQGVTLTAQAMGFSPISYQWYLNGALILSGFQTSPAIFAAHTNAGTYVVVATTHSGSITSNPAQVMVLPAVSIAPGTLVEGDTKNTQHVSITTSAPLPAPSRVEYILQGGPRMPVVFGQLLLPAGATNGLIPVTVAGNLILEPAQSFSVTLSGTNVFQGSALFTIVDDDAFPMLTTTVLHPLEGDGVKPADVMKLELSAAATNEVSIQFQTSDGTALAGHDYAGTNGTITFEPGATVQYLNVTLFGDLLQGEGKTFDVLLSNPLNAFFTNDPVATVQILNDDELQILPGFNVSIVATSLYVPTAIAVMNNGVLVCEQTGRVIEQKGAVRRTILELGVLTGGFAEAGLLGITLDPNFANNRHFYVYYTPDDFLYLHNRISRFTYRENATSEDTEQILLELDTLNTYEIHNGGGMRFGPDGKLYVGVGESGLAHNSQALTNLLGKILRLNSDGTIPTDNPFYATTTGKNRAIWAYGLRNPWRLDFQPGTGRLFINDVGQSTWEEINEGIAGANYGWPFVEGISNLPQFDDPYFAYGHSQWACSITGGAFANSAFPSELSSAYFFADYCGGFIRWIDTTDGSVEEFASGLTRPVDLQAGPDGGVYVLSRSGSFEGTVLRIQAAH